MMSRQTFAVLAAVMLAGCTIHATAAPPQPNVIPPQAHAGSVKVDTSSVPPGQVCSVHEGLKSFCIDGLHGAVTTGLKSMLGSYVTGGGGPAYSAVFRMIEFSHSPATGGQHAAAQVAMRWQFELLDGDRRILALAQDTVGPELLINVGAADKTIRALLNTVLETIAAELNKAEWQPAQRAEPPATAPAS